MYGEPDQSEDCLGMHLRGFPELDRFLEELWWRSGGVVVPYGISVESTKRTVIIMMD